MKLAALPLPLGKCSKRDAFAIGECRVEPARPEQQRDNGGSGFAANGSVLSIPILILLAWRGAAVTARTREETGLDAAKMTYVGHLFEACGYSNQGYHIFLATKPTARRCRPGARGARPCDAGFRTVGSRADDPRRWNQIKDATTVASLGLLRLKGLL
jgi:hypothetical protein